MKEEINKKEKILGFSLKTLKTKVFCLYRQRHNNRVKKTRKEKRFSAPFQNQLWTILRKFSIILANFNIFHI